ncbi:MAG: hypothetical protein ABSE62_07980 [Chthoniobacteraceae bacterium]|jgi:hypothetical protein
MASRRRPGKSSGPLDERQQKLLAEQEKLQQRVEQLNRVIAEAPRIKAERERAQRESLLAERGSRGQHRLNSNTFSDTRYDQPSGATRSRRPLKAERRQTLLIFLGLLVALSILVLWLLSVWRGQWGI